MNKAVYVYAAEDYEWWSEQLGRSLAPGTFGENLTTDGLDIGAAVVGQRWRIGDALFEVSEPRMPCYKLGIRMDDPEFPDTFARADRPGTYLRIIEEGSLAVGDRVEVGPPPSHGLTVSDVARIYHRGRHQAHRLLEADELSDDWRRWVRRITQA